MKIFKALLTITRLLKRRRKDYVTGNSLKCDKKELPIYDFEEQIELEDCSGGKCDENDRLRTESIMFSDSEMELMRKRGFTVFNIIGEGSYSKVVKAEYVKKDDSGKVSVARLACKVMDKNTAPPLFVKKFLPREIDILPKMNHPDIVHIHSMFRRGGKYFVFMRQCELGDLLSYVMDHGELNENHARLWFRQMSLAVQYMHTQEIVHRDLKLENMFVTKNLNVKVGDFDFARYTVDSKGHKVMSETYCGSLAYAAPEILRGTPYDPKMSDVWSLGCILFAMLNKRMPFPEESLSKLYSMQMKRKFALKKEIQEALSAPLKALILKLLEPTVNKRITADELSDHEWFREVPLTADEKAALEQAKEARKINNAPPTRQRPDLTKDNNEMIVIKDIEDSMCLSLMNNELSVQTNTSNVSTMTNTIKQQT